MTSGNVCPTLVVWGIPIRFQSDRANPKWRYKRERLSFRPEHVVVGGGGGGAKGLEFTGWCRKCLGSGGVPLLVAGGC